jgi:hypothetical protein
MKKLTLLMAFAILMAPSFAFGAFSAGVKGGLMNYAGSSLDDDMILLGADFRIDALPMVNVIVSAEYAWKKYDAGVLLLAPEVKYHNLAFTGSAVYPIKLQFAAPYAGVGLGTHSFTVNWGGSKATTTKLGYHILGGATFGSPGMPFKFFGEFRHYWVKFDTDTAKFYTISGGVLFGF